MPERAKSIRFFLSQSHYPLKGLHMVAEALPLVLRHYPDARVHVAGPDILSVPAWRRNGTPIIWEN